MLNFLFIINIALAIYNIIFTIRMASLEDSIAIVKKFIYGQTQLNVNEDDLFNLINDRLKKLEEKEVNEDDD